MPDAAGVLTGTLAGSVLRPLWLDSSDRPAPRPALGPADAGLAVDLVVVGGGFTGLWAAVRACEREPGRSVLLLEADRIAEHATGRNGGFCEASLTHGEANGRQRWPGEYDELERLGLQNLDEIAATIERYGIDCGFDRSGTLAVATRPHEVAGLSPSEPGFLGAEEVRRVVDSPTYLAGRVSHDDCATLDPARLAWGLARVAESLGVRIAERTPADGVRAARVGGGVVVTTPYAEVRARQVVLATNVFRPLLKRLRLSVVPVYDYVLATEPLTAAQVAAVGWTDRVGISDSGNQFHYYRLTPDDRVLFGGYDAIYHYGRSVDAAHEDRPATYATLARHFAETFPQLADVRFTHRWAGAIDTCTRFCAFFGVTRGRRIAYATGFTGLGVGASRFGADVMLDLLAGASTERTRLEMVRTSPLPFPPEPLAWVGIQLTRWSLAREDRTGRRNAWLRVLDRLGLGFDS
ncbi:FAD-dependent oxidoreductase [Nocardioides sp. KIGAM211]|uniref:FAD-dependent oxidoreductase n=1 Tax=Nocardioides luti TaxID=2761101 RepID=A0A7X0RH10_9ACTN|nr:FAD-dependent oxidoreductase [Nocardioides luti]MBB6628164.1 FAD-dependent oxidoreductase [Nocardioides luti]